MPRVLPPLHINYCAPQRILSCFAATALYMSDRYLQNGEDVLAYDILPGAGEHDEEKEAAVLYLPAFDTTKDTAKGRVIMDCAASLGRTYVQMDWYGVGRSSGDFTHKGTITRWTNDALKVSSFIHHMLIYASLNQVCG